MQSYAALTVGCQPGWASAKIHSGAAGAKGMLSGTGPMSHLRAHETRFNEGHTCRTFYQAERSQA